MWSKIEKIKLLKTGIPQGIKPTLFKPKVAVLTEKPPRPQYIFSDSKKCHVLSGRLIRNANVRIISGLTAPLQLRYAHTDIRCPDFDDSRAEATRYPDIKASQTQVHAKIIPYVVSTALFVVTMYGTKAHLIHYIAFMDMSADVLAVARIEVRLNEIPEGKSATFKWRGKPLFVFHRSQNTIDTVRAVPLSILRDPQADEERVKKPEWLVVLGICTHLGCVPIANAGDFGGYYCPCHGSHFDASGRARKGPAPTNLEVPPYNFVNENTLVVG